MTWNYRLIAFIEDDELILEMCRVYYDDNNVAVSYSDNISMVSTDGLLGIKLEIDRYTDAMNKPILDGNNFPNEYITSN